MKNFDNYFEEYAIIEQLIRFRVANAAKRHDLHFMREISGEAPNPIKRVPRGVEKLLPPRRYWCRLNSKERKGLTSQDMNRKALLRTIFCEQQKPLKKHAKSKRVLLRANCVGVEVKPGLDSQVWGRELLAFVERVQSQVLKGSYCFSKPAIIPLAKPRKDGEEVKYRVLATYTKLEDRVIMALASRYLRDQIESKLSDDLYSFRRSQKLNRTAAVEGILDFRAKYQHRQLFASECDLKAFFDTVSHHKIWDALERMGRTLKEEGAGFDIRLMGLLKSFLGSYDFYEFALPEAVKKVEAHKRGGSVAHVEWADLNLPAGESVGLPQGGAFSPILANLLLAELDQNMAKLREEQGGQLFYARFCDDMILVSPLKKNCQAALRLYLSGVEASKLLVHPPQEIKKYDKSCYSLKSKKPYRWGAVGGKYVAIPWIAFLGYQIRFNGLLRIREQSIKKEKEKQI